MMRRPLYAVVALMLATPLFAAPEAQQNLFNFARPTDVAKVVTQGSALPSLEPEFTDRGEALRRLVFHVGERPTLQLTPQQGTWDWSQAGVLGLRIQNAQDWAITLDLRIESSDGKALTSRIALPAGPAQTLLVPLHATTPRDHGMRAGPPMPFEHEGQRLLLAEFVEGELNPAQVSSISLSLERPDANQNILLGRVLVEPGEGSLKAAYTGIVDAYGQYTRGHWPEKVNSDAQLKQASVKEKDQLKGWLDKRPEQDRFGGWMKGPSFEARGFFRTEKHDGRWYLVTPEGHPFYSLGVNTVTANGSQTYVEGRESMFTALPKEGEPLAAFYGQGDNRSDTGANKGRVYAQGRWYDFYRANLQRTYGDQVCPPDAPQKPAGAAPEAAAPTTGEPAAGSSAPAQSTAAEKPCVPEAERWVNQTLDRLQGWGFNTLGNWSDNALGEAKRMPYTLPLSIQGDYATISTGHDWWGGIPDPFDPRFAMAAERAIAIATRDHREDPWLLGYFADNELAWAGVGTDPKARYALAYGTLRLTTDVPAKRAFLKQLRDKYRNQQGLSAAWGIDLPAWELLEDPGFEAPLPSPEHPAIEEDFKRFQKLFADTYFKTISDSLDWHAPNHLLLGGRFAVSTPEAVEACAQYCDVLSFNFYTREPQQGYDFDALRALDKPVLITEFHFGSRDRGPFWGGVAEVYKEEERGPAYAHFLKQALTDPMIVGAHWFQYLDQPVTGRLLDGENGHLGLVGITDRPFQGFVEAVRKANLDVPKTLLAPPAPVGENNKGEAKKTTGEQATPQQPAQ
ncbi:beta-agarase [Pseudomonas indica]|uniref:beta-agarase n=1 Tax=Pseudomonas indica TaxID=137658 RepID=UPI003FD62365